jgi:hypothetical protein
VTLKNYDVYARATVRKHLPSFEGWLFKVRMTGSRDSNNFAFCFEKFKRLALVVIVFPSFEACICVLLRLQEEDKPLYFCNGVGFKFV